MSEKLEIDVIVNGRTAKVELDKIDQATKNIGDTTTKTGVTISNVGSVMGRVWSTVGTSVIAVGVAIVGLVAKANELSKATFGMSDAMKNYITETSNATGTTQELIAGFVQTGRSAGLSTSQIKEMIDTAIALGRAMPHESMETLVDGLTKLTKTGEAEGVMMDILERKFGKVDLSAISLADKLSAVKEVTNGVNAEFQKTTGSKIDTILTKTSNAVTTLGTALGNILDKWGWLDTVSDGLDSILRKFKKINEYSLADATAELKKQQEILADLEKNGKAWWQSGEGQHRASITLTKQKIAQLNTQINVLKDLSNAEAEQSEKDKKKTEEEIAEKLKAEKRKREAEEKTRREREKKEKEEREKEEKTRKDQEAKDKALSEKQQQEAQIRMDDRRAEGEEKKEQYDKEIKDQEAYLTTGLSKQAEYYELIGETEKAWAIKEKQLRRALEAENLQLSKEAIDELVKHARQKDKEGTESFKEATRLKKEQNDKLEASNKAMADSMAGALTNFVMTGKLQFEDFVKSIIAQMMKVRIAQSITGALTGTSYGSFLGFHTGGYVGGIPSHHNGSLRQDERIAKLQVGEAVINRAGASRNKEAIASMNAGASVGTGAVQQTTAEINFNVTAIDSASFNNYLVSNRQTIEGIINRSLSTNGSVRQTIKQVI